MKIVKPGMRNIKTAIAIMLCMIAGRFNLIQNTMFAVIACIVCMQTTIKGSVSSGFSRIKGTFIGGLMGFLFVLIKPQDPFVTALGTITTIHLCNLLNLRNSIELACVVFCTIQIGINGANPLDYSLHRIVDTTLGIVIALSVNYFICRPKYLKRIYNEINIIESTSIELLKIELEKGPHANLSTLRTEINKLEELYKTFLGELKYSNESVDNKELNEVIKICSKIYTHLEILKGMSNECYLDENTYANSLDLYNDINLNTVVKNNISPVYNYHVNKIIECINVLKNINIDINKK